MKIITLDWETYYDDAYSLRKMTPVEYVLDPRFEAIGCAVKEGWNKSFWLTPDELKDYLAKLPPETAIISHNALFDMCVLAWRFDYVPHLMIDTLGMARAWLGHKLRSLALSSIALHLGIGAKGTTVHQVKGMGLAAIKSSGFYDEYAKYSCNDADLCYEIYSIFMREGFPPAELAVMDTVIRCAVKPRFVLNQTALAEHLHNTITSKQDLLAKCGLTSKEDLMSNDRFAAALEVLGVDPPTKISLVTNKEAYAFAKTDQAFLDLEEHDDPRVQALVSARLGVKSTLEETRTQRLLNIARLTWPSNFDVGAWMPMPLRFSGAHTHRLSGDWKLNMQNLPARGNNKIRSAICAPPGHEVVTCDAAQIEARVVAWLCGEQHLVDDFANKVDVYSDFASFVFGYPVHKKTHLMERFVGKTSILGLGFGMGWAKFMRTANLNAMAQLGIDLGMTPEQAANIVKSYRTKYPKISNMWKYLNGIIPLLNNKNLSLQMGPVRFEYQSIVLPNGLKLYYHKLEQLNGEWWFEYGGKPQRIYGGKMLENIVQALARIIVMDAAVRVRKRLKALGLDIWLNLQVHDELVYIVPTEHVQSMKDLLEEEMSIAPAWGAGIPLAAEAESGASYGDAK